MDLRIFVRLSQFSRKLLRRHPPASIEHRETDLSSKKKCNQEIFAHSISSSLILPELLETLESDVVEAGCRIEISADRIFSPLFFAFTTFRIWANRAMQTAAASASKYSPSSFFAGPESSQPRSKRTLPYPLPDPYEEVAEIYDPRGLFTKSRRTSGAQEGKNANEGKVSGLALSLATAGEAEPCESAVSSRGDSRAEERVPPLESVSLPQFASFAANVFPSQNDSNAHGAALSAALQAADSPSPAPTKFRSSNSLSPIPSPARDSHRALRKLRIGSGGAMDMPRPDFVASPAAMPIPPRSQSRGRSDTLQNPQDDEEDLRSRGSSPYADVAWSPAVGFLSSFSESNMSGRFDIANRCAGDAEGFEVEGYVLGKELGAGGFGVVREAKKIGLDREKVAVKIVRHAAEPVDSVEVSNLKRSLSGFRGGSRRTSLAAGERNRSSSSPGPPPNLVGRRVAFQDLSASVSSLPPQAIVTPASVSPQAEISTSLPPSFEIKSPPSLLQSLLEREISLWQQLAPHPHIVPLLNVHHTADFSYIFMPLCEGGNLLSHLNDHVRSASRSSSSAPRGRAGRKSIEPLMLSSMSEEFTPAPESNSSSTASITAVQQRRGLPLSTCLPIFAQVVSGLHYLHTEAAVTHKDVKLENILCDEKGGTWKIADFGLAETGGIEVPRAHAHAEEGAERRTRSESNESEILSFSVGRSGGGGHAQAASDRGPIRPITSLASLSRANSLSSNRGGEENRSATFIIDEHLHPAGSLPYSSPEQMSSPTPILDPSVDIWALGCVLYALVEGRLPFEDMYEPRLRMKILSGEWERPSSLLPTISLSGREDVEKRLVLEVLEGCLELDPANRWTIERVKECDWLNSERKGRGRAGTRPTLLTRTSHSSSNPSPASTSQTGSRSPSTNRRKERSTSRGPSTHYGVDPRTRSIERSQVEKEGRKQRWEGRGGVGVLAGRSQSKSGSVSRSGSRSRTRDLSNASDPY